MYLILIKFSIKRNWNVISYVSHLPFLMESVIFIMNQTMKWWIADKNLEIKIAFRGTWPQFHIEKI